MSKSKPHISYPEWLPKRGLDRKCMATCPLWKLCHDPEDVVIRVARKTFCRAMFEEAGSKEKED
ncbi:MAG: hypothetical protein ACYTEQ_01275 [Planctomycetota bacterium]